MEEQILEYLEAVEGAVAQHGPQAVELALLIARIDAAHALVTPLLWTAFFAVVWAWPMKRLWSWAIERDRTRRYEEPPGKFVAGLASVAVAIPTLKSVIGLMNGYAWVGLFSPEVWIAYKAMQAVIG